VNREPRNLAASIHQRLLNGARARGEDPQFAVQRYAAERFLYRLGESPHREQFVLKGAMLFALWGGSVYRPTRDLDFTGYGSSEIDAVMDRLRDICSVAVPDDGMFFDGATVRAEPIREDVEYGGVRLVFEARLGSVRVRMQVDVGFGNAIEPRPTDADFPALLDAPAPRIRAYPQEAVVAEKLHAMVVLGERNSRYKDFYDLQVLAHQFPFDGMALSRSIAATFERRRTPIDTALPVALAPRFYADRRRAEQWRAYLTRNSLPGALADFDAVGEQLQAFLGPPWAALVAGTPFSGAWRPAGPWRPATTTEERER
jgi:Nucleotidyl transferase AbiEii toxin, Type IV TA system